jgi:hypothetical protein
MTIALAAALLLAQADEARLKTLIDALAGESIEDREQAVDELVRIGAAAVPGLKSLAAQGSPEMRARATDIIKRIERAALLKEQLRPPRLVTLRWEKKPLREALAELREKSGIETTCADEAAATPVTFSCDDRPAWAALADACLAHGGLRLRNGIVVAEAPAKTPERMVDGFCVRGEYVRLETRVELGAGRRHSTQVALSFAWDGARNPRQATVRVDEFVDSAGTDLRVPNSGDLRPLPFDPRARIAWWQAQSDRLPDEKATSLTLRGRAVFSYALGYAEAVFDAPDKAKGQTKMAGAMSVTLVSLTTTGPGTIIQFNARMDGGDPPPPWGELVVRDDAGTDRTIVMTIQSLRNQLHFSGYARDVAAPRELRVRIPTDVHKQAVPFEFKDVPIR